jgi:hypothetical protein
VLSAYHYGNLTYPSEDPPRMGFKSTVPPNASELLQSAVASAAKFENFPSTFKFIQCFIILYLPLTSPIRSALRSRTHRHCCSLRRRYSVTARFVFNSGSLKFERGHPSNIVVTMDLCCPRVGFNVLPLVIARTTCILRDTVCYIPHIATNIRFINLGHCINKVFLVVEARCFGYSSRSEEWGCRYTVVQTI